MPENFLLKNQDLKYASRVYALQEKAEHYFRQKEKLFCFVQLNPEKQNKILIQQTAEHV